MRKLIHRFRRNESGAALAEYAVLVALIAVVAIGTLSLVGTEVNKAFTTIKDQLVTANGKAPKAPQSGGGGSSIDSGS